MQGLPLVQLKAPPAAQDLDTDSPAALLKMPAECEQRAGATPSSDSVFPVNTQLH